MQIILQDCDSVLSVAIVRMKKKTYIHFILLWFVRILFSIHRFGIVVGLRPNVPIKDMKQTCQKMLRQLAEPKGWIIGKTKVTVDD